MTNRQKQQSSSKSTTEEEIVQDVPQGADKTEGIDDDIDDILADIDEVLESNAEEFVKAYTQKGGQ